MEKFIPYEKLSKKKQRELNAMKRVTWGSFNPVTRKPANPKAYNRRTAQRWKDDSSFVPFLFCLTIIDIVRSSAYNKKEIFDNNLELIG